MKAHACFTCIASTPMYRDTTRRLVHRCRVHDSSADFRNHCLGFSPDNYLQEFIALGAAWRASELTACPRYDILYNTPQVLLTVLAFHYYIFW